VSHALHESGRLWEEDSLGGGFQDIRQSAFSNKVRLAASSSVEHNTKDLLSSTWLILIEHQVI
jgi:hypothetical protein